MASPYEDALNTIGQMDQRLANWQNVEEPSSLTFPSEYNPVHSGLGLTESPTSGGALEQGLGLAQRGLEAITPSRDTLYKFAQGLEAAGAVGRGATPLYLQQQHQDLQRQQILGAAEERKQMMALRIQEQEEAKRQHNWGIAEKLITTGNHGALEEFSKTFPDVLPIVQGVNKQNLATLPILADGGYLPDDIVQRVMNPGPNDKPMTGTELGMHVQLATDNWKADLKENAKNKLLTNALNTPEGQRKPHQQLLVDEHQKKLDLQEADIELKKAQAARARHEAEVGTRPDRSLANKVHQSMFGVDFEQGTEASQAAALESYFKGSAQGRQNVTENIPVSQTGKAQELRDPVTGKAAPGWATPKQLAGIGAVNIEPNQIPTVTQLQNVDESMKEILKAGSTLLRKETGSGNLFEIPLGFLQRPIVSLIKKYAGDPDAQLLQSAIGRITPTLSKLGGDVANVAVAEREIYAQSIFNEADTLESFTGKIKSITDAQKRTRSSMGFVPDEKTYIQRVITQNPNMSDEQIKAIVSERKRMFQ